MVFDLSGVHRLVVRYCGCDGTLSKDIQLLDAYWFPATIYRPATAFAFDILDFFHKLQDQNKCNPYDFYHAITQRSDAAGLNPEIVLLLFILFAILSLTDSPVSLQRDNARLPPLVLPSAPQARWCRTPLSRRRAIA